MLIRLSETPMTMEKIFCDSTKTGSKTTLSTVTRRSSHFNESCQYLDVKDTMFTFFKKFRYFNILNQWDWCWLVERS